MARRIIVATFPGVNAAYEAAHAIRNLQDAGIADFQPRAGVMLAKDERGNLSLLETRDRPLFGTAVGTASGMLIGALAGLPGLAIGAVLGATSGLGVDAVMATDDSEFTQRVGRDLRPGMAAIVLEADEGSTQPVDDVVRRHGGQVNRQAEPVV